MRSLGKNRYNLNGDKNGYWEEYYDNGNLWYKGSYVNGSPDGYWEFYWYDGNLSSKGSYVNGNRTGYWEFHSDGKLERKGYYEDGYLVDEPLNELLVI